MSAVEPAENFEFLPWYEGPWGRLQQIRRERRLPHALLLAGPSGLGKVRMAIGFAQGLLCDTPLDDGRPCGRCKGCRVFSGGAHPDFIRIQPDEESKSQEITVDAIRELVSQNAFTPQFGGYKVVLITPADRMNRSAANSLLKTLEEPVPNTVIILVTSEPHRLLPTIRSRCQQMVFDVPPEEMSLAWLANRVEKADARLLLRLAGNTPLAALALDNAELLEQRRNAFEVFAGVLGGRRDPVASASALADLDLGRLLRWMAGWVGDLLRLHQGGTAARLTNPDHYQDLQPLAEQLDCTVLHRLLERIYEAQRLQRTTVNPQLALEALLISCRAESA